MEEMDYTGAVHARDTITYVVTKEYRISQPASSYGI